MVHREFLRRSLDGHLLEAEQGGELGPGGRAGWLAEHLEIYVTRCVGFAALPTGAGPVLDGSLFGLVEIGTEALRQELEAAPPAPGAADAWRAYLCTLERWKTPAGAVISSSLPPPPARSGRRSGVPTPIDGSMSDSRGLAERRATSIYKR